MFEAIFAEGKAAQHSFKLAEKHHRRGHFPAINVGVTMGMGYQHLLNLDNGDHAGIMDH